MNTAELVDEVAAQTGMAKDGVRKVLDAVLGAVAEAAKAGQAVMLSGFGQFRVQDHAARQARNPATGETIEIAASRELAFTAAKPLREGNPAALATTRLSRAVPSGSARMPSYHILPSTARAGTRVERQAF
jgi:DNA-binding protein HU-beta